MFLIKLSNIDFDYNLFSFVTLCFYDSVINIYDLDLNDVSISVDLIFVAMKSFFILSNMWM
jgi:hypothetical protein